MYEINNEWGSKLIDGFVKEWPDQWSATWGMSTPGGTRKHFTSIKTKHKNRLDLQPAMVLALRKIRPRIEVQTCQKQAQSSH
jgi:hypothetical protein